jgi:hypothetical protein
MFAGRTGSCNVYTEVHEFPMKQAPRICPICLTRRANTKEDILPQWVREIVLKSFGPGKGRQLPPRIVMPMCDTCNGTLNGRFEIPARPILAPLFRGEIATLTPSQQSLASGWIIKGELLMFFWRAHEHPEHPHAETIRRIVVEMMECGLPPNQTTVRLGRVDPRENPRPAGTTDGLLPAAVPQSLMHSVSTTGPVFWEAAVGVEVELGAFIAAAEDGHHLVRLWPPSVLPIKWPPAKTLTFGQVEAMRTAWKEAGGPGHARRAVAESPLPGSTLGDE